MNIIILALATTVFAKTSNPVLWGSQIVSTRSGTSRPIILEFRDGDELYLIKKADRLRISIVANFCMSNGKYLGFPCYKQKDYVNISIHDVEQYTSAIIYSNKANFLPLIIAYFVPHCQFSAPQKDGVILNASFPFSKFAMGQEYAEVEFAVEGANSESLVYLYANEEYHCIWKGITLVNAYHKSCANMTRIPSRNMRLFQGRLPQISKTGHDNYLWTTDKTNLTVSVDWKQNGVSSEVEDCKNYNVYPSTYIPLPTTSTTSKPGVVNSQAPSRTTTSSGPFFSTVDFICNPVIIGLLTLFWHANL